MSDLLPTTNADGLPVVPMSEEHKYLFDLKGWVCLPELLTDDQVRAIREHQMKFRFEPESLPVEERNSMGGPSQVLLDHPVIVGVLRGLAFLTIHAQYGLRRGTRWHRRLWRCQRPLSSRP
jgi:hypothetical protein